jgi:hypothetical protein
MRELFIDSTGKKLKLVDAEGNEFSLRGGSISVSIDEYDDATVTIKLPMGQGVIKAVIDASKKQQP